MSLKHLCACAVAVLVFGWGLAPQVWAEEPIDATAEEPIEPQHEFVFEDLGTTQTGTAVWKLVCPSGTTQVRANVTDFTGGNGGLTVILLRASTGKAQLKRSADLGTSQYAIVTGGAGIYYVVISKTTGHSISSAYGSEQQCLASPNNFLTHTQHQLVQDPP